MKKSVIAFLAACSFLMTACSGNNTAEKVAVTEAVSEQTEACTTVTTEKITETAFSTTAAKVTTATTAAVTAEHATEASFYCEEENDVPENAAYKIITMSYYLYSDNTSRTVSFYDCYDNVILKLVQTNSKSGEASKTEYKYEYNADGTAASKEYKSMTGDIREEYEYSNGLVIRETKYLNGEWYGTLTHTLNEYGHPITTEYEYASEGGFSGVSEFEYEYDENGRVIRQETESKSTEYYSSTSYTYDEKGNLKSEDNGVKKKIYTYDSENRLIKLEGCDNGSLSWYEEYEYIEF